MVRIIIRIVVVQTPWNRKSGSLPFIFAFALTLSTTSIIFPLDVGGCIYKLRCEFMQYKLDSMEWW